MTTMDIATVDTLRRTVGGSVLRPGDDGFAESTFLWNAMIDRAPALVVQPTDTHDVATAVDFARPTECRSRSVAAVTTSRVRRSQRAA